jgi:hypothetical protein
MSAAAKTERLEARVPIFLKRIIQRAADLQGRSITDFVIAALDKSARETVRDHEVMKLNAEANKGTKSPEFVKRMTELGYIIMGTSPETMADMNKAEVQRWGPIVKASGAKAD